MFFFLTLCIVMCDFCIVEANAEILHPLSDQFIDRLNLEQNLWTAGRNFHQETPLRYLKRLMGTLRDTKQNCPRIVTAYQTQNIPKDFDGRLYWSKCPSLYDIRDQGDCGSCWAVAAVSAMTDRMCINSNGSKNFYFSAEDALTCCNDCGLGCDGGILLKAWKFYKRKGIVSGGGFGSNEGCVPYEVPPCEHNIPGKCENSMMTPDCEKSCKKNYKLKYSNDKRRGRRIYCLKGVSAIKEDILNFGPVTTFFDVYSDFLSYKSGIYARTAGEPLGEHSVKIIGWGEEKGTDYWLVANSWNTDWGDNGFFKIISGDNEKNGGFESHVVAGR